ncbi:MAG: hypothetical protein H6648_02420 [Caldilineae bacterium]|nr:hypothetical protein [Caldilineae bacterium]
MHDESLELSTARGEQYWNYVSQHVAATDGSITHTVRAEWVPDGVGGLFPHVLGWTLDSSAAFLYMGGGPDGCGVNGFSQDIWRVSTDDGSVLNLGSVPGIPSLSRDATRIGGSRLLDDEQGEVTWIEAATATQHSSSFPVPQDLSAEWAELSPPIWSPDGKSIVVRVAYNGCSAEWHETLVFHDLVTGASNVVAESSEGFATLYVEDWQPDDALVVSESVSPWANSNSDSVERRIDARTGRTR